MRDKHYWAPAYLLCYSSTKIPLPWTPLVQSAGRVLCSCSNINVWLCARRGSRVCFRFIFISSFVYFRFHTVYEACLCSMLSDVQFMSLPEWVLNVLNYLLLFCFCFFFAWDCLFNSCHTFNEACQVNDEIFTQFVIYTWIY